MRAVHRGAICFPPMTQTCSAVALFFFKLNKKSSFLFFLNEVNCFLSHHMLTSVRSLCNSVCNPHWRAGSPKCLWEPLCVCLEEGGPKEDRGAVPRRRGRGALWAGIQDVYQAMGSPTWLHFAMVAGDGTCRWHGHPSFSWSLCGPGSLEFGVSPGDSQDSPSWRRAALPRRVAGRIKPLQTLLLS